MKNKILALFLAFSIGLSACGKKEGKKDTDTKQEIKNEKKDDVKLSKFHLAVLQL